MSDRARAEKTTNDRAYAIKACFDGIDIINDKDMRRYVGRWNPEDDDGDSMRLAIRLKMIVNVCVDKTIVDKVGLPEFYEEPHGLCDRAATRRAIFNCAVAVGKTLP